MRPEEIFRKGLRELGLPVSEEIVAKFFTYLSELKRWNRAYNLTALTKDEEIVTKHFLDSLLYLRFVPDTPCSIADIGSGAGFPGIPMAIARPELTVCLIEPSRKRCSFLRHMKRNLPLPNVEVVEARVEEVQERQFDIVVTRALFSVAAMVREAGHLVREGGFFILSKGQSLDEEIGDLPQGVTVEVAQVPLPGTGLVRNIIRAFAAGTCRE
ncbi:MAG: 16S rRNA (guanine(527)-N(7))-methyltransferase RsmG [Nitrospirales bacterium]|nr:16S rRNA (guanine(527)-N(7))-methyltransferase RsmG [Nitrospirales bacterium]